MKQCPVCKTTYTDESLQFCLADGASLFISSLSSEQTQQFPATTNPIRVNFAQEEIPTVVASAKTNSSLETPKKGDRGVNLIIGLVVGFIVSALLATAMFAGYFWWMSSNNQKATVANTQPNLNNVNSTTKSPIPDEAQILKEKIANLEKKMQEQKNSKQTVPTISNSTTSQSTTVTARANSPGDGFLALRTGPSSETGERIMKIPHGATLTVLACLPKAPGKNGRWCRVNYNGNLGWAFDGYMVYQ